MPRAHPNRRSEPFQRPMSELCEHRSQHYSADRSRKGRFARPLKMRKSDQWHLISFCRLIGISPPPRHLPFYVMARRSNGHKGIWGFTEENGWEGIAALCSFHLPPFCALSFAVSMSASVAFTAHPALNDGQRQSINHSQSIDGMDGQSVRSNDFLFGPD